MVPCMESGKFYNPAAAPGTIFSERLKSHGVGCIMSVWPFSIPPETTKSQSLSPCWQETSAVSLRELMFVLEIKWTVRSKDAAAPKI